MPFTRHPLEYPYNKLLYQVGLALNSWIPLLTRAITPQERQEAEELVARRLKLPQAIEEGLLKRYSILWGRNHRIYTIELVPDDRVRRTPGIRRLKELFFPPGGGK